MNNLLSEEELYALFKTAEANIRAAHGDTQIVARTLQSVADTLAAEKQRLSVNNHQRYQRALETERVFRNLCRQAPLPPPEQPDLAARIGAALVFSTLVGLMLAWIFL